MNYRQEKWRRGGGEGANQIFTLPTTGCAGRERSWGLEGGVERSMAGATCELDGPTRKV